MSKIPFGLQVITVRDYLEKDFEGTLKKIKEIGYDAVELAAWYANVNASECRKMLDDAGLAAIGDHVLFEQVTQKPEEVIENAKTLGMHYVTMPYLGGDMCPDTKSWLRSIDALDRAGAQFYEAGLQLCYHNHSHEFAQIDGRYIFDLIYERTRPEHLQAEFDTYWAKFAGVDPVETIARCKGRCPLLHIKDMTAGDPPTFTEVGNGIMDWDAIFRAGAEAGAAWFIVEQDECQGDSMESARRSAAFMAAQ